MGTVLPGQESDILKLPGQRRGPPGWGAGNRAMPPELRACGSLGTSVLPAVSPSSFPPPSLSFLPGAGAQAGWGPERKSPLFLLLMFSLERGFSCVHVPDLSQPRSSGFRTTVWTAAQAEVIRYLSRAAAPHAQGGPAAAPSRRPGPWTRPPPLWPAVHQNRSGGSFVGGRTLTWPQLIIYLIVPPRGDREGKE